MGGIMKHLFKPHWIKSIILILIVALGVKMAWVIVELTLLDATGVEYTKSAKAKALYYRTQFANDKHKTQETQKPIMSDINSFKLLAIYRSKDLVVVTISKADKSSVLVKGDTIDGYILDDATAIEAIFLRNNKRYRLELMKLPSDPNGQQNVHYVSEANANPRVKVKDNEKRPKGEIVQDVGMTVIDKSLINHYGKNLNDIWQNIGIKEVMDGRKITGFKVNFVKRGSDFSKLGLRRGDIIKSVNGEELDSYNSAFELYKNIDTIENLTLTIMRDQKEMELNYEIN